MVVGLKSDNALRKIGVTPNFSIYYKIVILVMIDATFRMGEVGI